MEIIKTKNLTFTYPGENRAALTDISMRVIDGEFITLCGKSGCGKTTLLRQLKPAIAPFGAKSGEVFFEGRKISELPLREQTSEIGFVMQNPDNQIITDKVWHELAFGLENLGLKNNEIRARVAEMAAFFGIGDLFNKNISALSGGQKQVINLASVMVMQPKILLLDEPTSQLDPIAAQNFIEMLSRINREIGTTVILSEHRLEEAFAVSDRVIVMEEGKIIADNPPKAVGEILKKTDNDMYVALPTPMRVHFSVENSEPCPLTVREGKAWLEKVTHTIDIKQNIIEDEKRPDEQTVICLKDIWFRYEKNSPDVLKGINLDVKKGEFYAVVGGNGTGKTTLLSVISSTQRAYRGKVKAEGKVALLPQNPQTLFTEKTVALDLERISKDYSTEADICDIVGLLGRHPYDLSGGEMQRVALAKVLLTKPDILLMDEPTKGLDAHFKEKFADIIGNLANEGITVIMVSHDIEFCSKYAHRCGMLFDGVIVSEGAPRGFFTGKSFYTTAANRMARSIMPDALLAEDIIFALGGKIPERKQEEKKDIAPTPQPPVKKAKLSVKNIISGIVFAALFLILQFIKIEETDKWLDAAKKVLQFIFLGISLTNLLPKKESYILPQKKKSVNKLKT
ncbi:MAG: ATP-binding cassette domain-containing protein, partial [Monoglobales bacterium]